MVDMSDFFDWIFEEKRRKKMVFSHTTKEAIKTDDDLNKYGWKMRLIQVEEDIYNLNKKREEILSQLDRFKEE